MKDKRILFMGTPDFACEILRALIENNYHVIGVVTQPDKPVGRKKVLEATPTKALALKSGIPVFQPLKIRNDYQFIVQLNPDMIVTCAYGQLIPKAILDIPSYGCINVHASLLPKLRGGAPIHHALIQGYEETGVTIMKMEEKMDTGPIYTMEATPISENDDLLSLYNRLKILGAKLLLATIPKIFQGLKPYEQNHELATYAFNIKRHDEQIDWSKPANEVYNHIRGLSPHPGSYTTIGETEVKIFKARIIDTDAVDHPGNILDVHESLKVACSKGVIEILELQVSGKKRMDTQTFLRGQNLFRVGMVFHNTK